MKVKEFKMPEGLTPDAVSGFKAITDWGTENFQEIVKGLKSIDEVTTAVTAELEKKGFKRESIEEIRKALIEQGSVIEGMKESAKGASNVSDFEVEMKSAFEALKSNKGKGFEVEIKAAAPVMTPNVPARGLRFEIDPVIQRLDGKESVIYDLFLKGQTESRSIHWINYKAKEGGAAFIGEGELKPLEDWLYEEEVSNAKKIAVRSKHSEEIFDDFEDFMSEVRLILTESLTEKRDNKLLLGDGTGANPKGVITDASAYIATGGLNGQIIDPNLADVVVALALQVKALGRGKADLAVVNPYDHALLKLAKNSNGNYLAPELQALLAGITVREHGDMPAGSILVCDSRKQKVKNKKGILMKTIYEYDDMSKNMVGFVVEQFLHSYRSSIHDTCFVYDQIETVKASLLKANGGDAPVGQ